MSFSTWVARALGLQERYAEAHAEFDNLTGHVDPPGRSVCGCCWSVGGCTAARWVAPLLNNLEMASRRNFLRPKRVA